MRTIRLELQYDGTDFSGWQSQRHGERTIQDTLSRAVADLTGESNVSVIASGRTDAGVHALAQVASFQTESPHPPDVILRALNARLPNDVVITDVCDAPLGFHPRKSALAKRYVYVMAPMRFTPALLKRYVWQVYSDLDVEAMAQGAALLQGTHDFRGFMAAGSSVTETVRTVLDVSLTERTEMGFTALSIPGRYIVLEIEGTGFLRHMVRIIAGTLVDIGRGTMSVSDMSNAINKADRSLAGQTAPPKGLYLKSVTY